MRKALTLICAFMWAGVMWGATLTLSPSQYAQGGYSTVVWNGQEPCAKSSVPAYQVWDTDTASSGGRSIAPEVSTRLTLACADGTVTALLTVGSPPPPVPPVLAGTAPVCYPDITLPLKVRTIAVDPEVFGGDTRLSVWTCRTATGYKNERWSWKLTDVAPWFEQALGGVFDESAARAWTVANAGVVPAAARAAAAALDQYEASAVVAPNGTNTTRPIYPLNLDGTRGTTALPLRATVGTACDITRRVQGTNYYAVPGGVTLCKFTAPAGIND